MGRVTVIAELGSSPAPAWDFEKWCAAAAAVGADAVKAQMFRAEHFPVGEQDSKRPLEFPRARLAEFVRCAHAYALVAGVSVFDEAAVWLAQQHCDFVKLAAREQRNTLLIHSVLMACQQGDNRAPVYRSVSDLDAHSPLQPDNWTTLFAIQRYPAPLLASLVGLARAAAFFRRAGVRRWGYSSHTRGTADVLWAVRLGATVIEKHLALGAGDLEAGHSLRPDAFGLMTAAIRRAGETR